MADNEHISVVMSCDLHTTLRMSRNACRTGSVRVCDAHARHGRIGYVGARPVERLRSSSSSSSEATVSHDAAPQMPRATQVQTAGQSAKGKGGLSRKCVQEGFCRKSASLISH